MGNICTRNCLFCSVSHGLPGALDITEAERICDTVRQLKLNYLVITSVTRDDLPDGGALFYAQVISLIKNRIPDITIEVLVPDFRGSAAAIETLLCARPDVFGHNIETVRFLFGHIRPEADYAQSLRVLSIAAQNSFHIPVKSGFMLGLGESEEEVISLMGDLREAGVKLLTIGQYLQPSKKCAPVKEFVHPRQFELYEALARDMGFSEVSAGPFVRSSYRAEKLYNNGQFIKKTDKM
jgi:lipoic acid synthetase